MPSMSKQPVVVSNNKRSKTKTNGTVQMAFKKQYLNFIKKKVEIKRSSDLISTAITKWKSIPRIKKIKYIKEGLEIGKSLMDKPKVGPKLRIRTKPAFQDTLNTDYMQLIKIMLSKILNKNEVESIKKILKGRTTKPRTRIQKTKLKPAQIRQ